MNNLGRLALVLAFLGGASGCQFHARAPDDYRKDTRALLETRSPQIQSCYDEALKKDKSASGTVVLHFNIAEETGAITNATVLPESTAPAPLSECVVKAFDGLALQPPDAQQGDATFVWEFRS